MGLSNRNARLFHRMGFIFGAMFHPLSSKRIVTNQLTILAIIPIVILLFPGASYPSFRVGDDPGVFLYLDIGVYGASPSVITRICYFLITHGELPQWR